MTKQDEFLRALYDRTQALRREIDALEKLVMGEIDVGDLPETRPSVPQGTTSTKVGVSIGNWNPGLRIEKTAVRDEYRFFCPAGCKSSEVYDKTVLDGSIPVKCRRCKFEYFVERDGGGYFWKAVKDA